MHLIIVGMTVFNMFHQLRSHLFLCLVWWHIKTRIYTILKHLWQILILVLPSSEAFVFRRNITGIDAFISMYHTIVIILRIKLRRCPRKMILRYFIFFQNSLSFSEFGTFRNLLFGTYTFAELLIINIIKLLIC